MTNPRPRPALRKAADAEIHPAAPRPARSPRARATAPDPVPDAPATPDPEPVVAPVAEAPAASLKPPKKRTADSMKPTKPARRKFSGSTSDHLRVPEVPEVTSSQRAALDHLFDGDPATTTSQTTKAKKAKKAKPVDLMSGKSVDLGASVPKTLRAATRDEAKRRGLDVDTVVTDLLHAWLTERR